MRFIVYGVAVLAAAGMVYALAQPPQKRAPEGAGGALVASSPTDADEAKADVPADATQLVLHVPEMHCPYGCYPTVKGALAKQPGVFDIELAEQKTEGELDNPRVLVTIGKGFDADAAIGALAKTGFTGSAVE